MNEREKVISTALEIFRKNYPSNFRGMDFIENFKISFNSEQCSFFISWNEDNVNYEVTLYLAGRPPQVIRKKMILAETVDIL